MPEQELKLAFSILGKLRAEIGEFQAPSLLNPFLLVLAELKWSFSQTMVVSVPIPYAPFGWENHIENPQGSRELQKISFLLPAVRHSKHKIPQLPSLHHVSLSGLETI